ncbi:MAG: hypothetical protein KDD11_18060 [Acidobacteria bacterium]|nr:hypothetical protein [Acidobacteriota bacterium]
MSSIPCPGCGAHFPDVEGPVHRYMESSPGCWAAYGEVLEREYGAPAFFAAHPFTVDAYAVQHPGRPSKQANQSVTVHLMSLCLTLEHGLRLDRAPRAIQAIVESGQTFEWLTPPADPFPVTVADVRGARDLETHKVRVREWAESAWQAWSRHHETIRARVAESKVFDHFLS